MIKRFEKGLALVEKKDCLQGFASISKHFEKV